MSRFSGLKANLAPVSITPPPTDDVTDASPRPSRLKARDGKKAVVGYFSEELSRTMRRVALDEGTTVQHLLGEAIDMLLHARGKHPFGER